MPQERVKLVKNEQLELPYYNVPSVEGITNYTQVTLVLNEFPT